MHLLKNNPKCSSVADTKDPHNNEHSRQVCHFAKPMLIDQNNLLKSFYLWSLSLQRAVSSATLAELFVHELNQLAKTLILLWEQSLLLTTFLLNAVFPRQKSASSRSPHRKARSAPDIQLSKDKYPKCFHEY